MGALLQSLLGRSPKGEVHETTFECLPDVVYKGHQMLYHTCRELVIVWKGNFG